MRQAGRPFPSLRYETHRRNRGRQDVCRPRAGISRLNRHQQPEVRRRLRPICEVLDSPDHPLSGHRASPGNPVLVLSRFVRVADQRQRHPSAHSGPEECQDRRGFHRQCGEVRGRGHSHRHPQVLRGGVQGTLRRLYTGRRRRQQDRRPQGDLHLHAQDSRLPQSDQGRPAGQGRRHSGTGQCHVECLLCHAGRYRRPGADDRRGEYVQDAGTA